MYLPLPLEKGEDTAPDFGEEVEKIEKEHLEYLTFGEEVQAIVQEHLAYLSDQDATDDGVFRLR